MTYGLTNRTWLKLILVLDTYDQPFWATNKPIPESPLTEGVNKKSNAVQVRFVGNLVKDSFD